MGEIQMEVAMMDIFSDLKEYFDGRNDIRLVYVPFSSALRNMPGSLAEDMIEVYLRGKLVTVITETEILRSESPKQLLSQLL